MARLRIIALALVAVVVLGVTYAGYRTYEYVEHDPRFCASCHIMEPAWNTWQQGSHKEVACKTCHEQYLQDRVRIVWHWATAKVEKIPPHTELNKAVCEKCHLSKSFRWPQIAKTAGHDIHVVRAKLECLACHLPSLHATQPTSQACVSCHSHARMNIGGMGGFHCTACHPFLAPKEKGVEPEKQLCLNCHGALQLKGETFPAGAPMPFECSACHKPHTKPLLKFSDCLGCHAQIAEDRKHFEMRALTKCVMCHRPHSWKVGG